MATNNTGARIVALVGCSIRNANTRLKKRDGLEDLPGMSLSRFGGQKDKIVNLT